MRADMLNRFVTQETFNDYKKDVKEDFERVDEKAEAQQKELSDHEARIKALEAKTIPDFFADIQALEKKHNAILEDH